MVGGGCCGYERVYADVEAGMHLCTHAHVKGRGVSGFLVGYGEGERILVYDILLCKAYFSRGDA